MRRLVAVTVSFLCAVAAGGASQQPAAPRPSVNVPGPDPVLYTETRTAPSTFRDRGPSYAPTYLVYADKQRSADEAKQLIKLVALDPYGHWNFKPAAADMWAFLSRYRRDPATGALRIASR